MNVLENVMNILGLQGADYSVPVSLDDNTYCSIVKEASLESIQSKVMETKYLREKVFKIGTNSFSFRIRLYEVTWNIYEIKVENVSGDLKITSIYIGSELVSPNGVSFIG